eukprot:2699667-Amphidinium_carterae.1
MANGPTKSLKHFVLPRPGPSKTNTKWLRNVQHCYGKQCWIFCPCLKGVIVALIVNMFAMDLLALP